MMGERTPYPTASTEYENDPVFQDLCQRAEILGADVRVEEGGPYSGAEAEKKAIVYVTMKPRILTEQEQEKHNVEVNMFLEHVQAWAAEQGLRVEKVEVS